MFSKPAGTALAPLVEKTAATAHKKVVDASNAIDALTEEVTRLSRQKEFYHKLSLLNENAAVIAKNMADLREEYGDVI